MSNSQRDIEVDIKQQPSVMVQGYRVSWNLDRTFLLLSLIITCYLEILIILLLGCHGFH
ncbi:uncharacterized protein LY89DRAFT_688307, partial [Mollisia scopiformis]